MSILGDIIWKGDEVEYRNLRLNYAPQGDSSIVIVFVQ